MTLIVDTSVIVKWFINEDGHDEAIRLLESSDLLACPDFALAEAANVLWRKVRLEQVEAAQAKSAIEEMAGFFDEIIGCSALIDDAFALAQNLSHSVYDCIFLAAAMRAPEDVLVTDDRKFAQKCVNAGFAERIRLLRGGPLLSELTEARMSELIELIEKSDQVLESVQRCLKGDSESGISSTLNVLDLQPAFDSPVYSKLLQRISALTKSQAHTIIAICWYGREITSHGFEQDYENAKHLAQDPEKYAGYISGLLRYFDFGLIKLRSSHPQLFPENGE